MLITHRCTNCGHPDYWRLKTVNPDRCPGSPWGGSCGHECTPAAPELVPTFDLAGQPVEEIVKPGDTFGRRDIITCGCDACKALYAERTGAAA